MSKEVLAIIPARGGSKRLPRKNIMKLNGKELIVHSIDQANNSKFVTRTIVNSDDSLILNVAKKNKCETYVRPNSLATDEAGMPEMVLEMLESLKKDNYKPDYVVILQPTSPLRESSDIDSCLDILFKTGSKTANTFCEVQDHPCFAFKIDKDNTAVPIDKENFTKRKQDVPKYYVENGAVFVFEYDFFIKNKSLYCDEHKAHIMDRKKSVDIDDEFDFKFVEFLMKNE